MTMSKLDEILSWDIGGNKEPVMFAPEMKQAFKDLMIELIGEDEPLHFTNPEGELGLIPGTHAYQDISERGACNDLKAELRKKVKQL